MPTPDRITADLIECSFANEMMQSIKLSPGSIRRNQSFSFVRCFIYLVVLLPSRVGIPLLSNILIELTDVVAWGGLPM